MNFTPSACTCRISPAGSGIRVRSNVSVPLHVSHGLSTSTQPSGTRAARSRVTSSSTSAGPVTTSRHLISASCDGGGTGGAPVSAS